jgi:hypothetical protein
MKLNAQLSAEVKNIWNFTSTLLSTFIMNCIEGNEKSVVGRSEKLGKKNLMKQSISNLTNLSSKQENTLMNDVTTLNQVKEV